MLVVVVLSKTISLISKDVFWNVNSYGSTAALNKTSSSTELHDVTFKSVAMAYLSIQLASSRINAACSAGVSPVGIHEHPSTTTADGIISVIAMRRSDVRWDEVDLLMDTIFL